VHDDAELQIVTVAVSTLKREQPREWPHEHALI
jgi:hypothetical protein